MLKETICQLLKEREADLRARGVEAIGLFGSVARGDASAQSDVDLLLTLRPLSFSLLDLASLQRELSALFGRDADLTTTPLSNPYLRELVERDLVAVF
jgi:uncharacterized protein